MSQLLRRVDPPERGVGQFFADEVAGLLGVDFFIGVTDHSVLVRRATFAGAGRLDAALHAHQMPKERVTDRGKRAASSTPVEECPHGAGRARGS